VVHTPEIKQTVISRQYAGFNRIPILMISPLLHRRGTATVPTVGGDRIGNRPINFHVEGLEKMGASVSSDTGAFVATADGLRGAPITLPYPRVGASENPILAAGLATGSTALPNG